MWLHPVSEASLSVGQSYLALNLVQRSKAIGEGWWQRLLPKKTVAERDGHPANICVARIKGKIWAGQVVVGGLKIAPGTGRMSPVNDVKDAWNRTALGRGCRYSQAYSGRL